MNGNEVLSASAGSGALEDIEEMSLVSPSQEADPTLPPDSLEPAPEPAAAEEAKPSPKEAFEASEEVRTAGFIHANDTRPMSCSTVSEPPPETSRRRSTSEDQRKDLKLFDIPLEPGVCSSSVGAPRSSSGVSVSSPPIEESLKGVISCWSKCMLP